MRKTALLIALVLALAGGAVRAAGSSKKVIQDARTLCSEGRYDQAIDALSGALDKAPNDPDLLLALGRAHFEKAKDLLNGTDSSLGELALLDAKRWAERAAKAAPKSAPAAKLVAEIATTRDDTAGAAKAYGRAVELDPSDGETCLALAKADLLLKRYEDALHALDHAKADLPLDPRVLLERGSALAGLGRYPEAERSLTAVILSEARAGRPGSPSMNDAFKRLWAVTDHREGAARAAQVYLELAKKSPKLTGAWWYLGHARLSAGDSSGAADAFGHVVALLPNFADGWQKLGEARVKEGKPELAFGPLEKELGLVAPDKGPKELLDSILGALANDPTAALGLLKRVSGYFKSDPAFFRDRGDMLFRAGAYEKAYAVYGHARELTPFGLDIETLKAKIRAVLGKRGPMPKGIPPLTVEAHPGIEGMKGTIFDFDHRHTFVRVNGNATGGPQNGTFHLERSGDPGPMANVSVTFIPTIDSRPFKALRFDVKGPKGTALFVRAKDGYDQFEMRWTRLGAKDPVMLTGDWQTVTIPFASFVVDDLRRPIPMYRARLRAIIFEIGESLAKDVTPAPRVEIRSLVALKKKGEPVPLASFDSSPEEELFLTTGAASALARTLSSPSQVPGYHPDPNTFVTPAILGADWSKDLVHSGSCSYRLTLPREGPAEGVLTFNPPISVDNGQVIRFWARGRLGGEKLRVILEDSLDGKLGNPSPASAPRLIVDGAVVEGRFALSKDWKEYEIHLSNFPDVDFTSLTTIRFAFGTPEGNGLGTTIYLDDIGWRGAEPPPKPTSPK